MFVMSTNGPLGAYVNPYVSVHAVMTMHKVNNLALIGQPQKKYCRFPGYVLDPLSLSIVKLMITWSIAVSLVTFESIHCFYKSVLKVL